MFLGGKCYLNQSMNNIPKTFRLQRGIKLNVRAAEVEICGSEREKKKAHFKKTAFKDTYCKNSMQF